MITLIAVQCIYFYLCSTMSDDAMYQKYQFTYLLLATHTFTSKMLVQLIPSQILLPSFERIQHILTTWGLQYGSLYCLNCMLARLLNIGVEMGGAKGMCPPSIPSQRLCPLLYFPSNCVPYYTFLATVSHSYTRKSIYN